MPYFSENENLEIGANYTRGELCDLMNIDYTDEIERGIYKPTHYSTFLFFSTIHNNAGYINGKLSNTEFLYSANRQYLDTEITQHRFNLKELLLFVRIDQETGLYYFGPCTYLRPHELQNYPLALYSLELTENRRFSDVKVIDIPDLSN